ncbi:Crp/Fnr family transcriptional regulator, partial [Rhizobium leguminosarum]
SAHLFTVLAGWGFRYKMLEDGRLQILNYIMPGDLVGLQGTIAGEMQHSVEGERGVLVVERHQPVKLEDTKGHGRKSFD